MNTEEKIKQKHLEFAESRGLDATYCPSDVARNLYEDWREKMDLVREVADDLVAEDKLVVMQKGNIISEKATEASGPIRLRKKR